MKECVTSIEQSKRLCELKLNPDTADMCYQKENGCGFYLSVTPFRVFHDNLTDLNGSLPAWSLNCLLEIIKQKIQEENTSDEVNPIIYLKDGEWIVNYPLYVEKKNKFLINAVFELVEYILENN